MPILLAGVLEGGGGNCHPAFGRSVEPYSNQGADYAQHITSAPLPQIFKPFICLFDCLFQWMLIKRWVSAPLWVNFWVNDRKKSYALRLIDLSYSLNMIPKRNTQWYFTRSVLSKFVSPLLKIRFWASRAKSFVSYLKYLTTISNAHLILV